MDIVLSIIVIIIIVFVWINVGIGASGGNSGFEELWRIPSSRRKMRRNSKDATESRQHALAKAKPFLKAYKDPMGELCLANENCKVSIMPEGKSVKKIICISKIQTKDNSRKILTASATREYEAFYNVAYEEVVDYLWDMICENFTYTTVYDNIFSALTTGMLDVKESVITVPTQKNKVQKVYDKVTNTQVRTNNLLNINTATEAELLALPGVNVVIAKKTIKYIEKNGPFESTEEFINKMKIKPVFAEQIKDIICTKIEESNEPAQNTDIEDNNSKTEPEENTVSENYIPHSDNERTIDL